MGVPESTQESKRRIEASFWSMLSRRHPLTWWWWNTGKNLRLPLLPEWSRSAFEREAQEWRRLAQSTVGVPDAEVQHWGRFARWIATRLLSGSFEAGAEPLGHANAVLRVTRLLDPLGERYRPKELLDSLTSWILAISDVGAEHFWQMTRMTIEASQLLHQISPLEHDSDSDIITQHQKLKEAINAYAARVSQPRGDPSDPIAWVHSAHMFVNTWRALRDSISRESVLVVGPPITPDSILNPADLPHFPAIQEVVVPGLTHWWLLPQSDRDVLYRGDGRQPSLPLAVALALWYQESHLCRLTWALTFAPLIDGGLMVMANLLKTLWEDWPPVKSGMLAQWEQRHRALAMVDAWLWLEAGDPADALSWLSRFVPNTEAMDAIPWMKSHPGYYALAYRVREELLTNRIADWEHPLFQNGPIMPPSLFLSPAFAWDGE